MSFRSVSLPEVVAILRLFPPQATYPSRGKVLEVWRRLVPVRAAHAAEHTGGFSDSHAGNRTAAAASGTSRREDTGHGAIRERGDGNCADGLYDDADASGAKDDNHGGDSKQPVLSRSLALAALYMLHVERWHPAEVPLRRDGGGSGSGSGNSSRDSGGGSGRSANVGAAGAHVPGISASRRDVLRRYANWVECACATPGCARRWNFANDTGLARRAPNALLLRRPPHPGSLPDSGSGGGKSGNADDHAVDGNDVDGAKDDDEGVDDADADADADAEDDNDDDVGGGGDDDDTKGGDKDSRGRRGEDNAARCPVAAYARWSAGRERPPASRSRSLWKKLRFGSGRRHMTPPTEYVRTAERWRKTPTS